MQYTDNSEKGFQHIIVDYLRDKNKYRESISADFDKEFCFNTAQLLEFIKETQPDKYDFIQQKGERSFLLLLDKKIKEKGIIETFRKGVKHLDKIIELYYPEPVSNYNTKALKNFDANIFSVTQELIYTDANRNRIDLVIFLNGLPLITMELKNAYTHQAVKNAIIQYKKTRSPRDKIFNFARCMVHFAADTDEVYMTTELKNGKTFFLPFNKGLNEGRAEEPFGKGNPLNPNGLKTAYLWEEILTKRSLTNIVENFAQILSDADDACSKKQGKKQKASKKLFFPRYHQLTVVRQLLKDTKKNGIGKRYLIQHSAGSGKSNSITWLAHQLSVLYDSSNTNHLFDSVIVVTDRRILDQQIRENIKAFAQEKRYVEAITGVGSSKTKQLKAAIINKKKIIITTVQTFPFLLGEMQDLQDNRFAIIIDEAHSSQSGDTAAKMNAALASKSLNDIEKDEEGNISTEDLINHIVESRKMLKNASYFAFTATPKNKTLETFGVKGEAYKNDKGEEKHQFYPFHTYSMKQAIDEGFILDVLQNYTTYKSYYKIKTEADKNDEYDTKEANKKLRSYVEMHEFAIGQKARYMLDHFHRDVHHLIKHKAKAMIVTKSIVAAMKYKDAFDTYLKEINSPYKAIVAFSGKKKHYKSGEELTEAQMNSFPDADNDIPCQFRKNEYRFLIVAEKFQTGFDQPLLHTMYVDKQLSSIATVQTLSRLNRSHPEKSDTFVLDFFNEIKKEKDENDNEVLSGDIIDAFQDYYTTSILSEETDANKLNEIEDKLGRAEVYDNEEIEEHFKLYYSGNNRSACEAIINKGVAWFDNELSKDKKIEFKSNAKIFVRTYSYLSKLLDFTNERWEMLWIYLKYIIPKLHIEEDEEDENILEVVNMDSYRISKIQEAKIDLVEEPGLINPIPVSEGGREQEKIYDTLENILSEFNKRFGDIEWSDKDKAYNLLFKQVPEQIFKNEEAKETMQNSDRQEAKAFFDKELFNVMFGMMNNNIEVFKKFNDDKDFQSRYGEFIFDMINEKFRTDRPTLYR